VEVEQVEELNYSFDRLGWLEHEGHLHRKVLFLDLKFWIKLSDPNHEQLKALLSHRVETGKLICPVSPSILMELSKLPRSTHRNSISQIMSALSKDLSLLRVDAAFRHEFKAALDGRQAERKVAYSHFLDVFHLPVMVLSITDFMNGCLNDARGRSTRGMQEGSVEKAQQENEWRRENQPTRKEVEGDEWWATFRELSSDMLSVLFEESERDPTL
jgi:hypothetical protein